MTDPAVELHFFDVIPVSVFWSWMVLAATGVIGYVIYRERSKAKDHEFEVALANLCATHDKDVLELKAKVEENKAFAASETNRAFDSIREILDKIHRKMEYPNGSERYLPTEAHRVQCAEHTKLIDEKLKAQDKQIAAIKEDMEKRDTRWEKSIVSIQDSMFAIATAKGIPEKQWRRNGDGHDKG